MVLSIFLVAFWKPRVKTQHKKRIAKTHHFNEYVGIMHPFLAKSKMHELSRTVVGIKLWPILGPTTPWSTMPRLTQIQRNQAIGRLEAGESVQDVARHFNVNITTIYRLLHRYNATQTTDDLPRSGRPRVTTPRQDRQITRQHQRHPFLTASESARQTIGTHNRHISRDTVIRRLRSNNLRCRRPARRPVLQPRHRQARLQWAQGHRNWRHREWRRVIFSDESRFCVSHADGRVRIWRRRGDRFADRNVVERDPWGGPSVMIWAGIGLNARLGPMCFLNVGQGRGHGVTAQRYIDQVIRPHVVPFFAQHQQHIFQQDNARPHVARATMAFLQQHNIHVPPWPALSPDLNPIEHLWDEVQRRLHNVRPVPTTADELRTAALDVCRRIPRAFTNRLIHSMYRRCVAVINANGGHTRY